MTIGERIRYYRKNADMTQRELAATTGIHYVSICNYESGKMIPREDQIRKIADALGISYSSLNNSDSDTRRFQTLGNLFELLMSLHRSGVMTISGKRDPSSPQSFCFISLRKQKDQQDLKYRAFEDDRMGSSLLRRLLS